jgi:hypothetical protein
VRRLAILAVLPAVLSASTAGAAKQTFHAISLSFAEPPRRIAISFPAGTKLRDGKRIGTGSASLHTGFAPPLTEIPASVTISKRRRHLILTVAPRGGDLSTFTLTATVKGSRLTMDVPPMCVPGYSPCHEIWLDRLTLSIRGRFVRKPGGRA